jgi:hypothetical protein
MADGKFSQVGISYLKWLSCERMQVSVEEAGEKLPELIALVERGELITITPNEIPVAELMPSKGREG